MKKKPPSDSTPKSSKVRGGYIVGYRKPPDKSKFQPGKSGNPKGRPKRLPNLEDIAAKLMKQKVTITEGGNSKRISFAEALTRKHLHLALKGDRYSTTLIADLYSQHLDKSAMKEKLSPKMNLSNLSIEALDALEKALLLMEES